MEVQSLLQKGKSIIASFIKLRNQLSLSASGEVSDLSNIIQEQYETFVLFSVNLGLFNVGHASLDYRLRDNTDVRNFSSKLLSRLEANLESLASSLLASDPVEEDMNNDEAVDQEVSNVSTSPSSSEPDLSIIVGSIDRRDDETELQVLCGQISSILTQLLSLASQIRDPMTRTKPKSNYVDLFKKFSPEVREQIMQVSQDHDREGIRQMLRHDRKEAQGFTEDDVGVELVDVPESEHDSFLVERLVKANHERRCWFNHWRKSRSKQMRAKLDTEPEFQGDSAHTNPKDSLSKSGPTMSHAASYSQHMSTLPSSKLTSVPVLALDFELRSIPSVRSSYSRTSNVKVGKVLVRWPEAPIRQTKLEFGFECPYCFFLCPNAHRKEEVWRDHLRRDISPYQCTYQYCQTPSLLYQDYKSWNLHEQRVHRSVWVCKEGHNKEFPSVEEYKLHVKSQHESQATRLLALDFIDTRESALKTSDRPCPFCFTEIGAVYDMQKHIAAHLEAIALLALPSNITDSDKDGKLSEASGAAQRREEVAKIVSEDFPDDKDRPPRFAENDEDQNTVTNSTHEPLNKDFITLIDSVTRYDILDAWLSQQPVSFTLDVETADSITTSPEPGSTGLGENLIAHMSDGSDEESSKREDPSVQTLFKVSCEGSIYLYHRRPVLSLDHFVGANGVSGEKGTPGKSALLIIYEHYACKSYSPHGHIHAEKDVREGQLSILTEFAKRPIRQSFEVSGLLQQAFRDIASYHGPHFKVVFPNFGNDTEVKSPYVFYFNQKQQIREAVGRLKEDLRSAAETLLSYLDEYFEFFFPTLAASIDRGWIHADTAPYLFRPGSTLVRREQGLDVAYCQEGLPTCFDEGDRIVIFFEVGYYVYDGTFNYVLKTLRTFCNKSLSERQWIRISDLSVYPLEYAGKGLNQYLVRRGHNFRWCHPRRYVSYPLPISVVKRRFMIDGAVFSDLQKTAGQSDHQKSSKSLPLENTEGLSDRDLILLPATIKGFDMIDYKWMLTAYIPVDLQVDKIQTVQWNRSAFDELSLYPDHKRNILALLQPRANKDPSMDILDTGSGLTLLIQSAPGTGKRLMVESIADKVETPLFRVTYEDIDTNPLHAQQYLKSVMYLAEKWRCILYISSIDLLLHHRSKDDPDGETIRKVLQEAVERFSGTLILTAEDTEELDHSFGRYIDYKFDLGPVTHTTRAQIWRYLLRRSSNVFDILALDELVLNDRINSLAKHELRTGEILAIIASANTQASKRKQAVSFELLERALTQYISARK